MVVSDSCQTSRLPARTTMKTRLVVFFKFLWTIGSQQGTGAGGHGMDRGRAGRKASGRSLRGRAARRHRPLQVDQQDRARLRGQNSNQRRQFQAHGEHSTVNRVTRDDAGSFHFFYTRCHRTSTWLGNQLGLREKGRRDSVACFFFGWLGCLLANADWTEQNQSPSVVIFFGGRFGPGGSGISSSECPSARLAGPPSHWWTDLSGPAVSDQHRNASHHSCRRAIFSERTATERPTTCACETKHTNPRRTADGQRACWPKYEANRGDLPAFASASTFFYVWPAISVLAITSNSPRIVCHFQCFCFLSSLRRLCAVRSTIGSSCSRFSWKLRFQAALKKYGVPDEEIFQTADLYERRNIPQVTLCLNALSRLVSPRCFCFWGISGNRHFPIRLLRASPYSPRNRLLPLVRAPRRS